MNFPSVICEENYRGPMCICGLKNETALAENTAREHTRAVANFLPRVLGVITILFAVVILLPRVLRHYELLLPW